MSRLCPLTEPNEAMALKAQMEGWFFSKERRATRASWLVESPENRWSTAPASSSERLWLYTSWTFEAYRFEREGEVYG